MLKKLMSLAQKYKEVILYLIFGVATTIISFSVFWGCEALFGKDNYLFNNVVSWFCAVTFACFTNKFLIFKSKSTELRVMAKEIGLFYSSRVMTLLIEEAGLWLLVDIIGLTAVSFSFFGIEITGQLISKLIVGFVSVVINYLFSKFVTFSKRNQQKNK